MKTASCGIFWSSSAAAVYWRPAMTPVLRRSCGYPNKTAWWRFVFYLLAVAMGIDLWCSPGALVSALVISSLAAGWLLGYCFVVKVLVPASSPASLPWCAWSLRLFFLCWPDC
ncbi:hypothetical protein PVAP13_2NG490603 [Panicum virgatum]|uniref:Uncharacterized protein n=1 Tax=Panicum virgatum TaxID=38727 RepID=A0A8T0VUZ3_PANVG|nr:hypothetical protein PVAP13_2NG490603 [Panicum virgatum]